jgi:hypothetical protein
VATPRERLDDDAVLPQTTQNRVEEVAPLRLRAGDERRLGRDNGQAGHIRYERA